MEEPAASIIAKLNIETDRPKTAFDIFLSSIKTILDHLGRKRLEEVIEQEEVPPILWPIKNLSEEEVRYLDESLSGFTGLPIGECQVLVQKIIPQKRRKSLASYYTVDVGTDFMARLAAEYYERFLKSERGKIVLADPFLGSGRTLVKAIKLIGPQNIELVYGIEPYYLSALVAYAALVEATGEMEKVRVFNGDAFKIVSESSARETLLPFISPGREKDASELAVDIVLTNPPFTRWSNMEEGYRRELIETMGRMGYSKFIERKDPSLQILSMFLVDFILRENGLVVAVLPASTFYTRSGEGYKRLLRRRYEIKAILENEDSSFSEDSGFKEIILVAVKSKNPRKVGTLFEKLSSKNLNTIVDEIVSEKGDAYGRINLHEVPPILDRNWSFFFENRELGNALIELINAGLRKGSLVTFRELYGKESIIRGIEMYGTNFFFIPNRFWRIVEEGENCITIRNVETSEVLSIERKYLIRVLRKPQNYSSGIVARPDTYALAIPSGLSPDDLDENLRKYIAWGESSGTAEKAIEAWKKSWSSKMGMWYSHIHYQVKTKRPFGNVFLPDKVDSTFTHRGVFANFTPEKTIATKNFYIIRIDDETVQKILTLWFNSSVFIALFLATGKKISDRLIRLLREDYFNGLILNPKNINDRQRRELLRIFGEIASVELPKLKEQLQSPELRELRRTLDELILDVIGVKDKERILGTIYRTLEEKLR